VSQLWNYSDFRFDNDPVYGNNRIAGVPQHVLRTTLAYSRNSALRVAGTIDWVPTGAYVDYANTLKVPSYVLFGIEASYEFERGVTLFLDARNLTDKRYVSDFSTVTDARTANTSVFYPGSGRAFYAGSSTSSEVQASGARRRPDIAPYGAAAPSPGVPREISVHALDGGRHPLAIEHHLVRPVGSQHQVEGVGRRRQPVGNLRSSGRSYWI
jgi:hypothetical protein